MEIKVERGRPTPEELAAVVALVQARAVAAEAEPDDEQPDGRRDGWAAPARNLPAAMPRPAPAAWRMSAWPGGFA